MRMIKLYHRNTGFNAVDFSFYRFKPYEYQFQSFRELSTLFTLENPERVSNQFLIIFIVTDKLTAQMENCSRLSSSWKERPHIPSKMLSTYASSHTRCESVSKPSKGSLSKKYEKVHTQSISSRKGNITPGAQSRYKHSQAHNEYRTQHVACEMANSCSAASPYRTSFSSMKGKKKNSYSTNDRKAQENGNKCLSSYNLKDYSFSKQLMNSSEIFSSMYVEPMEMVCLLEKDKPTLRSINYSHNGRSKEANQSRKRKKSSKNLKKTQPQTNPTKRSTTPHRSSNILSRTQKKSETDVLIGAGTLNFEKETYMLDSAKDKHKRDKEKKSLSNPKSKQKAPSTSKIHKTSSYILSPICKKTSEDGTAPHLPKQSYTVFKGGRQSLEDRVERMNESNKLGGKGSPSYRDVLNRTHEILNVYQKKMKKLYEEKVSYQRMYEKSRSECENLRKSLKKQHGNPNNSRVLTDVNKPSHRREKYANANVRTTKQAGKESESLSRK